MTAAVMGTMSLLALATTAVVTNRHHPADEGITRAAAVGAAPVLRYFESMRMLQFPRGGFGFASSVS